LLGTSSVIATSEDTFTRRPRIRSTENNREGLN
jgi:hypothetical protein